MDAVGGAPQTGTTIVACCFDGGVVLGADTRVTTGAPGTGARLRAACPPATPHLGGRTVAALTRQFARRRARAGTYISNRTSDKITPLADNVFLCRSGSAADTQAVSDFGASRRAERSDAGALAAAQTGAQCARR